MTDAEMGLIVAVLRRESGCGIMEARKAVEKLIQALKTKPVILDGHRRLDIQWIENTEEVC